MSSQLPSYDDHLGLVRSEVAHTVAVERLQAGHTDCSRPWGRAVAQSKSYAVAPTWKGPKAPGSRASPSPCAAVVVLAVEPGRKCAYWAMPWHCWGRSRRSDTRPDRGPPGWDTRSAHWSYRPSCMPSDSGSLWVVVAGPGYDVDEDEMDCSTWLPAAQCPLVAAGAAGQTKPRWWPPSPWAAWPG